MMLRGGWVRRPTPRPASGPVKNTNAEDDAGHVAGVDDGQDEHAVVEERLGDLRVAEVAGDLDVLDVDVLAHGVASAGRALVERVLQRTGTNAAYCSSGR